MRCMVCGGQWQAGAELWTAVMLFRSARLFSMEEPFAASPVSPGRLFVLVLRLPLLAVVERIRACGTHGARRAAKFART
jgi:hypothetical protein